MAKILTLEPDEKKAQIAKIQALYDANNLDVAYNEAQTYLANYPNDAQGLTVTAAILKAAEKTPIAYHLAKRATELRPDRAETWVTLGFCAQNLWLLDESLKCYRKALKRAETPEKKALYLNNIASSMIDKGDFVGAEKYTRDSLELVDDPLARHNLGLCLLAQRRWSEAWQYYSASVGTFNRQIWKYRKPEEPKWDGTKGQKVVVYGEQGLGDEISFCSMIPNACKDAQVIIDCDKRLLGLFTRSFPQAKVYGTRNIKQVRWDDEDMDMDASISMGELGGIYRTRAEDFPGTPYLTPCPTRAQGWRGVFDAKKKPCIGIAWSGGTWKNGAVNRYLPLSEWGPIFDAVDAHWVSLQYKDASDDIKMFPVEQYPWATLTKDYDDTAALVSQLDLVICIQTTVGHLAGALGVPVYCMVPENSQWRYGMDNEDIPWYDSMRVFKAKGSWGPVVKKVADTLGGLRARTSHQ